MYIFPRHRITQVHFNKTGGTSLRSYLESAVGEPAAMEHGKHNTMAEALERYGGRHILVTTVRNPYDRLVSLHAHRRKRYRRGERGASEPRLKAANDLSFREWIHQDLLPHAAAGSAMDQPLSKLLAADRTPDAAPPTVLKLEELSVAAPAFLSGLSLPAPALTQRLNTSPRGPLGEYLESDLQALIYEWDRDVFDAYYPDFAP
jgi:hypothetical protein